MSQIPVRLVSATSIPSNFETPRPERYLLERDIEQVAVVKGRTLTDMGRALRWPMGTSYQDRDFP